MWLDVNGERMQSGSTATMIFGVAKLVSDISQFMILEPGDVITTGTPPGVGDGKKPPRYLKAGDTVSLGVDGLGQQAQRVVAWSKSAEAARLPMRAARSYLGAGLAVLYAAAFVVAYWLYAQGAGQFMADMWLSLAAIPYILTPAR
jgi:hypothetical protein